MQNISKELDNYVWSILSREIDDDSRILLYYLYNKLGRKYM